MLFLSREKQKLKNPNSSSCSSSPPNGFPCLSTGTPCSCCPSLLPPQLAQALSSSGWAWGGFVWLIHAGMVGASLGSPASTSRELQSLTLPLGTQTQLCSSCITHTFHPHPHLHAFLEQGSSGPLFSLPPSAGLRSPSFPPQSCSCRE